jgi:hypothetical protein
MGFIKRTQKRRFEFKHFGVSHTLDHEEPGYERTLVHNPSTGQDAVKYVQKFDAVEGVVIDAEWYDRTDDTGTRYVGYLLTVDVGEEVINLDFPYGKPAYRVLTRHGRNVDWSKPIKFSAWKSKTKKGKDTHGVCFWQAGPDGKEAPVKSAHTIENPNGCPEPKETIKGLDFSDAERWLKVQFDKFCLPKIKTTGQKHQAAQPAAKAAVATATAATGDPNDPYGDYAPTNDYPPEEDSDIPF